MKGFKSFEIINYSDWSTMLKQPHQGRSVGVTKFIEINGPTCGRPLIDQKQHSWKQKTWLEHYSFFIFILFKVIGIILHFFYVYSSVTLVIIRSVADTYLHYVKGPALCTTCLSNVKPYVDFKLRHWALMHARLIRWHHVNTATSVKTTAGL